MSSMSDVSIPGEPKPTEAGLIRTLTLVASGLTAASIAVNLILQIAHYLKKRPVQPDQRTKLEGAGLALKVMRHLPDLVRQVRLLVHQIRRPA